MCSAARCFCGARAATSGLLALFVIHQDPHSLWQILHWPSATTWHSCCLAADTTTQHPSNLEAHIHV